MGKLTYKKRQKLPKSAFAIPEERAYPIHDLPHARNALVRVSAFGSEREQRRVRRAVCRRYPRLCLTPRIPRISPKPPRLTPKMKRIS